MLIRDLAVRRPQTVDPGVTARAAAQQMAKEGIGCLVVVEGKRPIGIVTDRDLALYVLVGKHDAGLVRVREIAAGRSATLPQTATLAEAARLLRRTGLRRMPVVDDEGALVGLVSSDDLLRAVATEVGDLAEALRRQLAAAGQAGHST
jgi:CBS domain-containing protein